MGWAGDSILVRLGTRTSSIFAAMFMSFLVSAACVWTYLLVTTPLDFLRSPAMLYFLISGCLQPLCARALFYEGLTRIGVSRAGPLRGAEPFFAAAIAVAFLHERPGLAVYSGTVLIVASVWIVSGIQGGEKKWRLLDSAFPLGAALVSAVSQSLRKVGLNILPNPFIAAVIVTTTSLVLLSVFLLSTNRIRALRMERGSFFYFLTAAGIATTAHRDIYVEFADILSEFQRLPDNHLGRLPTEILVEGLVVDDDLPDLGQQAGAFAQNGRQVGQRSKGHDGHLFGRCSDLIADDLLRRVGREQFRDVRVRNAGPQGVGGERV